MRIVLTEFMKCELAFLHGILQVHNFPSKEKGSQISPSLFKFVCYDLVLLVPCYVASELCLTNRQRRVFAVRIQNKHQVEVLAARSNVNDIVGPHTPTCTAV